MWKTIVAALLLLAGSALPAQVLSENYRDPSLTVGQEVMTDATYYAAKFNGRPTSSGELIDPKLMTAAMHTFPFGGPKTDFKYFRVTRLENGVKTDRSVIVKVNDHMPDRHAGIDLSQAAAEALDMIQAGRVEVVVERVDGPGAPVVVREQPTTPPTRPVTPVTAPVAPLPRLTQTTGLALGYADQFAGMKTKSGEPYDPAALTAGHRSLPVGTLVRVTRPDNQRSTVVRINDSGPRTSDRVIDLSHAATKALDMQNNRLTQVSLEVVPPGTVAGAPIVGTQLPDNMEVTPVVPASPTPPTRPTTKQGYGVQVAFSSNPDGARQMVEDLRRRMPETVTLSVKPNASTGRSEYRVVVGALPTYEQAVALRNRLAQGSNKDAFVVSLANL